MGSWSRSFAFTASSWSGDAGAKACSADEARYLAARGRLGNVTRAREEARDRWAWPWLDRFQQDVRYALRGPPAFPRVFAVTVIITLGLGIGANAAMFGVIDRLMFRPVPYLKDPDRVHRVYIQSMNRDRLLTQGGGYEYTTYLDLKSIRRVRAICRFCQFDRGCRIG